MQPLSPRQPTIFPVLLGLVCLAVAPAGALRAQADSDSEAVTRTRPAAARPQTHPRSVAFLVVDGVYNTELVAPMDVFQHIRFHSTANWPVTFLVSPDGKPVTTFEGLVIRPDHSFADAPPIDVLVVPSAAHSMNTDLKNRDLIDWVRRTGHAAMHVMSLCDGAFVLAQAGLLDGIAATTFPADQDRFGRTFPAVHLVKGVSFVDAGHALTSVGGARSYDVALWLVDRVWGEDVATGIGRGLVIDWDPDSIDHVVRPAAGR
ncbi:MAG: DJ-1/PfpI family protein [Acidobacteriota bacterium]